MRIQNTDVKKCKYVMSLGKNVIYRVVYRLIGEKHFYRRKYGRKEILEVEDTNQLIFDLIRSNKPFLVSRYGSTELRTVVNGVEIMLGLRKDFSSKIQDAICSCSGFYPVTKDHLLKFTDLFLDASSDVDVYAVWYNLMEDYMIDVFAPTSKLVHLEAIEPYRSRNPWSQALAGKKVLVVHPFADSIARQETNFSKLFEDPRVLPEFNLQVYQAVQSLGGSSDYESWFEALDSMTNDIHKLDFDIAIVGCGAYGMPLSARIKRMGKQVIHLAGATQILFGIRGARWDSRPEMQKYFNEYWIRPSENERPTNAGRVEGACYW